MAQRPDLEMIRRYVKLSKRWGFADEEYVKWAMTLPFFYMADKKLLDQPHGNAGPYPDQDLLGVEHVYNDYVMAQTFDADLYEKNDYIEGVDSSSPAKIEQWGVLRRLEGTVKGEDLFWCHLWVRQHPPENMRVEMSKRYGGDGSYEYLTECFIRTKETDGLEVNIEATPLYKSVVEKRDFGEAMGAEGLRQAKTFFMGAYWLMLYLKHGPKHLVEVTPTKKAKTSPALQKNRPWVGATGPRILLLDRMPTTQSDCTGTHASPKPHRRRGHWKTLSHPRFRHHPQYGKKIYVKPSFVGPRQATYEGNIYRLVEPLDPLVAI